VFAVVGLPFIEPELRENRGEIEAALKPRLPQLVKEQDIRGDLRVRSSAGGRLGLRALAQAALERGYDQSPSPTGPQVPTALAGSVWASSSTRSNVSTTSFGATRSC